MDLLEPVVKPYAWGSRYGIAELRGRLAPTAGPEAELWMGAHPSGPAGIERDGVATTLDAVVAADPDAELGPERVARFGPRLPYLLKVIAAEQALSIQVHPDREQARERYAAENARGVPLGDPGRNYVDDWPKPELLYALTPFEVLAGMRTPADAADLLEALDVAHLAPLVAVLRAGDARAEVLGRILGWPEPGPPLDRVVAACARLAGRDGPYAAACAATVRIAGEHPGDPGILASLLLRHRELRPGEALFMPAGGLHAYLRGVGLELLANSDNVLRAGLTGKHVDVAELLDILDPEVEVPLVRPAPVGDGVLTYPTPAPEFRLYRVELADRPVPLPASGPRIVLCVEGDAVLRDGAGTVLKLARGGSGFVPAADGEVSADGTGVLAVAAVGV